MPIYDYRCVACAHRFEVIHGVHADGPASCPACGEGPVVKAVTAPAIHFKGSGWAKMERRTSAGSNGSGAATSSGTGSAGGTDPSGGASDKTTGDGAGSKSVGGGSSGGSGDAGGSKAESAASKVDGGSASGRSEASAGSKGSD